MLLHVLPPGFHRIRHYGFLANRTRQRKLAECRRLLQAPPSPSAQHAEPVTTDYRDRYEALTGRSLRRCPRRRNGNMHLRQRLGLSGPSGVGRAMRAARNLWRYDCRSLYFISG